MRHRNKTKILDRKKAPRTAMLKTMAAQLILHEKMKTTEAKAKVIRSYVERLVTKSRPNDLAARRQLMRYVSMPNAVKKLLEVLGPRYKERAGGYTRITKTGAREGDGAQMAHIEFV
ncbi:MAG: 50S ribosomal protein L17 [bacterium]|nr:50S ribosomal protein L17 [bacterium]